MTWEKKRTLQKKVGELGQSWLRQFPWNYVSRNFLQMGNYCCSMFCSPEKYKECKCVHLFYKNNGPAWPQHPVCLCSLISSHLPSLFTLAMENVSQPHDGHVPGLWAWPSLYLCLNVPLSGVSSPSELQFHTSWCEYLMNTCLPHETVVT